jgi:hypothetical protein
MKTVAVLQSNYIPWKGYFDIIHDVDLFIYYDDVQYTKNDWRNRNRIKTSQGTSWLTVPVGAHNEQLIYEVKLQNAMWAQKHWKTIQANYSRSPYYKVYKDFLEHTYIEMNWTTLSELNQYLIEQISVQFLGIKTQFKDSRDYSSTGNKLDKLIDLLKKAEADKYISGPAAKNYIIDEKFAEEGIALIYKDYSNYPEYSQAYPPFDHYVTILDLLFNAGSDAPYYIWGWRM